MSRSTAVHEDAQSYANPGIRATAGDLEGSVAECPLRVIRGLAGQGGRSYLLLLQKRTTAGAGDALPSTFPLNCCVAAICRVPFTASFGLTQLRMIRKYGGAHGQGDVEIGAHSKNR
jgi:hypothetical protein